MPKASYYAQLGRLSSIIMILPSSMAAGWVLGYYVLDRYMGIYPWGSVIMTILGGGAGFYEIFKLLTANKRDDADQSQG
jgi:F0F1-type ATP synthase assembly protein I